MAKGRQGRDADLGHWTRVLGIGHSVCWGSAERPASLKELRHGKLSAECPAGGGRGGHASPVYIVVRAHTQEDDLLLGEEQGEDDTVAVGEPH